jgi:hypothetical protein
VGQRRFRQVDRQSGKRRAMGAEQARAAAPAGEVVGRAPALGQDQRLGITLERVQKLGRCIEQDGIGAGVDQMAH